MKLLGIAAFLENTQDGYAQTSSKIEECRHHGFSETMHLALSKHCSENVCDQDDFSVEALLPVLEQLERFCYMGDDRDIAYRILDGIIIDPDEVYQRILNI